MMDMNGLVVRPDGTVVDSDGNIISMLAAPQTVDYYGMQVDPAQADRWNNMTAAQLLADNPQAFAAAKAAWDKSAAGQSGVPFGSHNWAVGSGYNPSFGQDLLKMASIAAAMYGGAAGLGGLASGAGMTGINGLPGLDSLLGKASGIVQNITGGGGLGSSAGLDTGFNLSSAADSIPGVNASQFNLQNAGIPDLTAPIANLAGTPLTGADWPGLGSGASAASGLQGLPSLDGPQKTIEEVLKEKGINEIGGPDTSSVPSWLKGLLPSSLGGTGTGPNLLGTGLATGLGLLGANAQSSALKDIANQYAGYGAPYRDRLAALYANPSSFLSSPEVTAPLEQAAKINANVLSKSGNVMDGNFSQQMNDWTANQLFSKLGEEKNRLGQFGGLSSFNAAAPQVGLANANAAVTPYNVLSSGASDIFNPKPGLEQQLGLLRGLLGTSKG